MQIEDAMQWEAQRIPNNTHPAVPIGGEDQAATITLVGGGKVARKWRGGGRKVKGRGDGGEGIAVGGDVLCPLACM